MNVFEVVSPGLLTTIQDRGRHGWRRFGVPTGGAMDEHAAQWANRLLDNSPNAPVLECLMQGLRLRALATVWIAWTGAACDSLHPPWKTHRLEEGDELQLGPSQSGVWAYVAVANGFQSELILGSASTYLRAGLGERLKQGDRLSLSNPEAFVLPQGIAGRWTAVDEQRDYQNPPSLGVWRGPQWDLFSDHDRNAFFRNRWRISPNSDRVGYRLDGEALHAQSIHIRSEPVRMGSIQVPHNGQPIVTMRDGPTVGGYPKIGYMDSETLSWLSQCRPGQWVDFKRMD